VTRRFTVADLFCGAGGTSTGCLRAVREMGAELDLVAINHWDTAIATHTRNHPFARHFCINLDAANPAAIVEGGRLDLLLASPECVHFSRARGGKPVSDQRRASAYHVQRWVTALNGEIDRILIENVREFMEWGPLLRTGGSIRHGKDSISSPGSTRSWRWATTGTGVSSTQLTSATLPRANA